ncbi:Calmodulin-like protein 6 [Hibiscus syriacus]|uniref:Calmodulin-like protein 6 n=1 Tax=Hibiscus syriacus TaxID=106335 RepID=A0A6A3B9G6_HIBSY|nr:Calmodulin-like protein 6 [Hibiscus syriacus]
MDLTELERVFQLFDKNGDGKITKKDLSESLESLGISIPESDLTQMIEKFDIDGDDCVNINEFNELYQFIMGDKDEDEDIKEAFKVFDRNGDGYISVDELGSVLISLGLKQGKSIEDCKRMIMQVDEDGDGGNYLELKEDLFSQGDCWTVLAPRYPVIRTRWIWNEIRERNAKVASYGVVVESLCNLYNNILTIYSHHNHCTSLPHLYREEGDVGVLDMLEHPE